MKISTLICSITVAAVFFLLFPLAAAASSRAELGQVLKSIPPNGPASRYGTVIFRPGKNSRMEPVIFPHWEHRSKYTCRVCHLELKFSINRGETGISRSKNLSGKFCGACHNGVVAFSVKSKPEKQCDRCHTRNHRPISDRFRAFSANMPKSQFGNRIDWAKALNQGLIDPEDSILPTARARMTLPAKLAQPLELGTTAPRSGVMFSHQEHMAELDCSNCHPDIFEIQKEGTEFFSMERNVFGWYCGTCHMRVAFPMNDCHRCHPGMTNKSAY